ncbi:hypothetical protein NUU61_002297 [Penicillium alfredii]|uniref:MARVEL domain-containing protein n=1 Tax=Penicillium alfredii TaxID=1506179 RepID=A0A9W9FRA4_9EURO|nr:uncharacterized protein NUU61_002297 [Penicillium alfredii]KAJ5104950.1 hypothetical protein NUU61_002297 [Penicillium alfredii]
MSFIAVKLLRLGYSQAKKHHAKKNQEQQYQDAAAAGYPQPYLMSAYPAGAAPGTNMHFPPPAPAPSPAPAPASAGAKIMFMIMSGVRFLQFVFGLTVIGLYGRDVRHDHETDGTWHAKWVFALIAAFLATVTAIVHMAIPFCMRRVKKNASLAASPMPGLLLPQFAWEFVLCVLWLVLFGVFGKMYIGVHASAADGDKKMKEAMTAALGDADKIDRMRHAVWIDLINLAMWALTAAWVLLRWLKSRRAAAASGGGDAEKGDGSAI